MKDIQQKRGKGEPSRYLEKLVRKLQLDPAARESFISSLTEPVRYPDAILWLVDRPERFPFEREERLSWQPEFVDRLVPGQRPGAHALHEQGAYYCLDLSSVFAGQVLSAVSLQNPVVLDLCAAPGGKSVFAWRLLSPELLIANETIGKRLGALTSNIRRCALSPTLVTNRDPRDIAPLLEQSCELVVVDAPCSGQSLLTKGQESAGCFHPATINLNKNRQRRIIAEASRIVAAGGYLAYMTCTFSPDENEEIVDWFLKKFPDFSACEVPLLELYRSPLTTHACYRLWPQSGVGAGSFAALLRKEGDTVRRELCLEDLPISWSNPEVLREDAKGKRRSR